MSWPSMLFGNKDGRRCRERGQRSLGVIFGVRWLATAFTETAPATSLPGELRVLECALFFGSVVAFAGQYLQIVIVHFDFDLAEFSVMGRIRRIVAERVLAAQLLRDLVKRFRQMLLRIDHDGTSA